MDSNLFPEDKRKLGFYIIHNPNTKETYAGSGILGVRAGVHERALEGGRLGKMDSNGNPVRHWNYKLQNAYNKDPNFEFIAIPVDDGTVEENAIKALAFEQALIDEHWGNPLFLNLAKDATASMRGFKHSEETVNKNRVATTELWKDPNFREKVSTAQRKGWAALTAEEKRTHSERVSESLRKSYVDGSRISTAGQQRSSEFCENNSRAISDKWQDPEYREKQMQGRAGKMVGPNKKSISVNGVDYDSITSAAGAHGMTKAGVLYRLNAASFPEWVKKD